MIRILRKRKNMGKYTAFKHKNKPYAIAQFKRYITDGKLDEDYLLSLESYSGGTYLLSRVVCSRGRLTGSYAKRNYLLHSTNSWAKQHGGHL